MELTKREKRILSPNYDRREKMMLWLGIACLAVAILLVFVAIRRADGIKKSWDAAYKNLDFNVDALTPLEIKLKSMLLDKNIEIRDVWVMYVRDIYTKAILFFFLMGFFLTAGYFISHGYLKLIRKLQHSNPQFPPGE